MNHVVHLLVHNHRSIVLLPFEIILGIFLECKFEYDLYEILNENENELRFELQRDFKNTNCAFGFYNGTCGEWLPPTPTRTPCHHATLFDLINSRVESREQLALKDIFSDICNGNNIISDNMNENNSETFYDNEYDYGVLIIVTMCN